MSQTETESRDIEGGGNSGMCQPSLWPAPTNSELCIVDRYPPQPTPNQPPQPFQGRSDYSDSSWPLYSMYSNIAEDEDDKMAERCQKDKDGTLIFVSSHISAQMTPHINGEQ